ncbi:hypothetical protein BGW38_010955, partial [Lunasporangiospora selenospora]
MVPASYGEQNQVRELESLQKIVERTAGNLIDIPSTLQIERLQQQAAQNRSNEYTHALSTVKLPQNAIQKLHSMTSVVSSTSSSTTSNTAVDANGHCLSGGEGLDSTSTARNGTVGLGINGKVRTSTSSGSSTKAPSVRDVLMEKTVDHKTLGWMANAVGELQLATESIDVEDVGDLIVNLSPPMV